MIPPEQYLMDMDPDFFAIWNKVKSSTMTYIERGYALYKSVEYLCRNSIPGEFVECGVWRGGSCMLMAMALQSFGDLDRKIRLYDTFYGMTAPTKEDVIAWNKRPVQEKWDEDVRGGKDNFGSWAVGVEEVRNNMASTGYPLSNVTFVEGDICLTLENSVPESIALLRLDTDWYESTDRELKVLYPKLVEKGVLVVDDYGHFEGARKAVDEYFSDREKFPLLHRADYTGRVMVK